MKKIFNFGFLLFFLTVVLLGCSNKSIVATCATDLRNYWHDIETEEYMMCINEDNMPIFVDAEKALEKVTNDYSTGFDAIKNEFELKEISHYTYIDYKKYGWQLTSDDEEILKQSTIITEFFDNYENSFK